MIITEKPLGSNCVHGSNIASSSNEYLGTSKLVNEIRPLVSVCVTTYQHASYIRQCLDSILMQQTDFPFEVIIGEDESTDGTREICKEYAQKYPDKIRLFLRSRRDVIYIFDRPTGRYNFIENIKASRGRYIAICEGDDYWSDEIKMQKQFDFLEKNAGCSACIHDAYIYSEKKKAIVGSYSNIKPFKKMWANKLTLSRGDILRCWHSGPTASFFFRNLIDLFPEWIYMSYGADTALMLILSEKGSIGLDKNPMSTYRFENSQSLMGQDSRNRLKMVRLRVRESWLLMPYFSVEGKFFLSKRIFRLILIGLRYRLINK